MKIAGYEIIQKEQYSGRHEIVLGRKEGSLTPYVTWEHEINTDNYFWGHYFSSYNHAIVDYHIRLHDNWKAQEPPFYNK